MPQAIWTGYLGFGLVKVPVALHSATEDRAIHFNQLRKGTSHRVRYRKIDEVTGEELASEEIVRGFRVEEGRYVVVDDDELRGVAPGRSEEIEITDFVELHELDPVYFQKSYYLVPRTRAAEKAYRLLGEAMLRQNKIGIATLVMRDREYLVAVRPMNGVLALETLYFADEVRPANAVVPRPGEVAPLEDREIEMAEHLVASLSGTWDPQHYQDTYRARVMALIEAKRSGSEHVVEEEEPQANVVDLMAALEASLARTRARRGAPVPELRVPSAKSEQQSFEGMSRAELLDLAAEREVPGRTRMTKLQLVRALSEPARAAQRRPARRRPAS